MAHSEAPDLEALGTFIRDRRHSLRLTQTQLAARVGWVQEKISILEWGKYGVPSLPALARLGTALETSLPELLLAAGYDVAADECNQRSVLVRRGGAEGKARINERPVE